MGTYPRFSILGRYGRKGRGGKGKEKGGKRKGKRRGEEGVGGVLFMQTT